MLKELNKIAAGLLGLHGHPVEPWAASAQASASRERNTTSPHRVQQDVARKSPRRGRVRVAPRAWR